MLVKDEIITWIVDDEQIQSSSEKQRTNTPKTLTQRERENK